MRILVHGCSITAGTGFDRLKDEPSLWPNLVGNALNADVNNISVAGYDNQGIFIDSFLESLSGNYDLILIQGTALDRVILSPNQHTRKYLGIKNPFSRWLTDYEYRAFHDAYLTVNKPFEHWNRFAKLQRIMDLIGDKIYFINAHLSTGRDFFERRDSKFARYLIDSDNQSSEEINVLLAHIENTKGMINLDRWIFPYECVYDQLLDVQPDKHPGPRTHELIANGVLDKLRLDNIT